MMKIETIVGDVVLLVLQDAETLKELGIQKNKITLASQVMMKMASGSNTQISKYPAWKILMIKIPRLIPKLLLHRF